MTREEAIQILEEVKVMDDSMYQYNQKYIEALDMAIQALEQKTQTGQWVDGCCSICGSDIPAYIIDWKWQKDMDAKYCPNCGARMENNDVI